MLDIRVDSKPFFADFSMATKKVSMRDVCANKIHLANYVMMLTSRHFEYFGSHVMNEVIATSKFLPFTSIKLNEFALFRCLIKCMVLQLLRSWTASKSDSLRMVNNAMLIKKRTFTLWHTTRPFSRRTALYIVVADKRIGRYTREMYHASVLVWRHTRQ